MCYDLQYLTRRNADYAKRRGSTPQEIQYVETEVQAIRNTVSPCFHASGYAHPQLVAFTGERPLKPLLFSWGLIPFWVRDDITAMKISSQTINARSETLFEKPAFREAAKKRRCLIMVDGFFEHHHYKGKAYPFLIRSGNDEPLLLAGIWDSWTSPVSGVEKQTVTIVTTRANALLSIIHNNPKASEPRMPLILKGDAENQWLDPSAVSSGNISEWLLTNETEHLAAHTVRPVRGKNASGNSPEAIEKYAYEELSIG